mgnify:CR=1 FL=1
MPHPRGDRRSRSGLGQKRFKHGLPWAGTGSTANYFIDALIQIKGKIDATVASSIASEERLKANGFNVVALSTVSDLRLYIDGADEATKHLHLIKGGGGALTREKIVAAASETFICIADDSKLVDVLGKFPLPIEVIPMATSYVARQGYVGGRYTVTYIYSLRQRRKPRSVRQSREYMLKLRKSGKKNLLHT